MKWSFSSQDINGQKIFPNIQEKLEKFEAEESKRKAETSPELSKKEKKKMKNKERNLRKEKQQEQS